MLPLEGVKTQLTRKTFSIQVKKSFLNTTNASTGKLITVSFMEKENTVNTRPSRIAMDIEESGKRKIENGGTGTTNNQGASNRARTSRVRHASEVKTPPLKNYHKVIYLFRKMLTELKPLQSYFPDLLLLTDTFFSSSVKHLLVATFELWLEPFFAASLGIHLTLQCLYHIYTEDDCFPYSLL